MPTCRRISRRIIILLGVWVVLAVLPAAGLPVQRPPPEPDNFPEQPTIPAEALHDGQSLGEKFYIMRLMDTFERYTSEKHGQTPSPQYSREYIFEGDIVLQPTQALNLVSTPSSTPGHRQKRKADVKALLPTRHPASKRWDLPINYAFHSNFPPTHQAAVREGVAMWEEATCIRFTQNAKPTTKTLTFINDHVCYSYVGSNNDKAQQTISIGDRCLRIGHVVHEIGHALGFWHEHARNDRQEHLKILWHNIRIGQSHNFANQSWGVINNMGVPYDVGSVMHYSGKTFAMGSSATLQSLDPRLQNTMGQRHQLSFYDVKLANMAYCSSSCADSRLNVTCLHDGYQDPNNCSRCRCPDGLAGDFCDTVAPSTGKCGGTLNLTFDTMATIMSPGYPYSFSKDLKCFWLIKSPNGTSIRLEFQAPYMESGFCDPAHPYQQCEDFVEVRAGPNLALTGGRFCCNDHIQLATLKKPIISNSSSALVLFQTFEQGRVGFKLSMSIDSCGGCYSNVKASQKPCLREVVRECVQTWYTKEQASRCSIMYWGCSRRYSMKAVHRTSVCYSEEPYCCQGYQLSPDSGACDRVIQKTTTASVIESTSKTAVQLTASSSPTNASTSNNSSTATPAAHNSTSEPTTIDISAPSNASTPISSSTVPPISPNSTSKPTSTDTSAPTNDSTSNTSSTIPPITSKSTSEPTTTDIIASTNASTSNSTSTIPTTHTSSNTTPKPTTTETPASPSSSPTFNASNINESDEGNPITWSSWSQWSDCSVSCGGCGAQSRSRTCKNDQECIGESSEYQACGLSPCGSGNIVKMCGQTAVVSYQCGFWGMYTCYRTVVKYYSQTYHCCCGYTEVGGTCSKTPS